MNKLTCFYKWVFVNIALSLNFGLYLSLPENHFGDCLPKKCGNININFPFRIIEQQKSYCGFPGFDVICKNNKLVYFNISGSSYVIKNISYEKQTFQVVSSVIHDKQSCFGAIHHLNLTLNNAFFNYAANYSEILLLLNCPQKLLSEKRQQNSEICGAIAVYDDEAKIEDLEGKCNGFVSVAYEGGSENVSSIREKLEEGFSLKWTGKNCSACIETGGQCGYDQSASDYGCYCPDRTQSYRCVPDPVLYTRKRGIATLIALVSITSGSAALATLMVVVLISCIKRRHSAKTFAILGSGGIRDKQNVEAFLKSYGSLAPKRYKYTDIKKMTGCFKDKLGEGGFGVVYKGRLHDGQFVAVKKLNKMKGNGEDFINEVVSISTTNHVNVVALKGFCIDGRKRALVYEFLPIGSLEKFVYGAGNRQTLQFETLFKIAVGIARGLDYLHRGCNTRILHFDIKPHNILLDEEFCPKISDFGLAKLCPTKDSTVSMLEARGTIGFIAPEVFCRNFGRVSHKSDVYSYGMMVLDMACGRENVCAEVHRSSEMYFPEWIYNRLEHGEEVGAHAVFSEDEKVLRQKMILVSLWCIQTYPSNRPPINRVLEMLEGPLESLQLPLKPHLSSPPVSLIDFCTIASSTT